MAENFYTGVRPLTPADLKTVPFDARFPNQNQTRNCWQNYIDFHKCINVKVGGGGGRDGRSQSRGAR